MTDVNWARELGIDLQALEGERPLSVGQLRAAVEHGRRADRLWAAARAREPDPPGGRIVTSA